MLAELRGRVDSALEQGLPPSSVLGPSGAKYSPTERSERATSLRIQELCAEFRRRSRGHRAMAFAAQGIITLSIFGGIYLFGFAGQIAAGERRILIEVSGEAVKQVRSLREVSENNLFRAESEMRALKATRLSPQIEDSLNTESLRLKGRIESERANIAASQEAEAQAMRQISQTAINNDQTILAITTKIGSVLLLLFFVKVLVSIFRYYSRLATFYDSRADALASFMYLAPMSLAELSALISPDSLDFERSPDSPEPPSLTLIKELAALRGKGAA